MNHTDTKESITSLQVKMTVAIAIGFIALIWNMVALDSILKLLVMCFLGVFVFLIVFKFVDLSYYLWKYPSYWKSIIVALIIFIVIPFSLDVQYLNNKFVYLNTPPSNNKISFKITYEINRTGSGGSIGHEWTYQHYFNDTSFKSGDILTSVYNSSFHITSRFIENDSIDDIGEATTKAYNFSNNDNYKNPMIISQNVHVDERGG